MKLTKYYSFDECRDDEKILEKLDALTEDRKIEYEFVESDIIKIKDLSLTDKENKELIKFLKENDVLEDHDYDEYDDDMDDDSLYDNIDDDY
jgi:hypothetical protein